MVDPDGTLAQAMDYDPDWTDDDLIDYDDPEFADDKRIGAPEQKDKAGADAGKPDAENVTDVDKVGSAGSAADTPADMAPADGQKDATDAAPESAKKPDGAS